MIFLLRNVRKCTKDVQSVPSAITDIHKYLKKFEIICFDLCGVEGLCSSECGGGDDDDDDDNDDYY
jgi:hypothetical protein